MRPPQYRLCHLGEINEKTVSWYEVANIDYVVSPLECKRRGLAAMLTRHSPCSLTVVYEINCPHPHKLGGRMQVVNIEKKLSLFSDHWNPRVVGELNGQQVKLAKFQGEFVWHHHEHEDELFLVIKGGFTMEFRDKKVDVREGEFLIVPRGIEHRPVAENEVQVLLFEPAETLNTGDADDPRMRKHLERL